MAEGGGGVVLMRWWWAVCSRNTKGGGREGFGPQPVTELPWLGLGRAVWNGDGGWCVGVGRWHVLGGGGGGVVRSRNTRRGGAVWVKNPKPSRRGSVSGAPCGMAMGDGA